MNIYLDTEFHEYKKEIVDANGTVHKVDTIELISIGMVYENQAIYLISKDFDIDAAWEHEWLRKNVLIPIYKRQIHNISPNAKFVDEEITFEPVRDVFLAEGYSMEEIKEKILDFTSSRPYDMMVPGEKNTFTQKAPTFWAYYADYDWVVFAWIFGRMIDLPTELPHKYPMYCRDLKQLLDESIEKKIGKPYGTIKFETEIRRLKAHHEYPKNGHIHNALADAVWNKKLHEFIEKYINDKLQEAPEPEATTDYYDGRDADQWFDED